MPYKNPEDQRRAARAHYQANKEIYKARAVASNRRIRKAVGAFVQTAKAKPCADCGIQFEPCVMQFDHLPGAAKLFTISRRTSKSAAQVRLEIAKCEVVCANCHCVRTHRRRGAGQI